MAIFDELLRFGLGFLGNNLSQSEREDALNRAIQLEREQATPFDVTGPAGVADFDESGILTLTPSTAIGTNFAGAQAGATSALNTLNQTDFAALEQQELARLGQLRNVELDRARAQLTSRLANSGRLGLGVGGGLTEGHFNPERAALEEAAARTQLRDIAAARQMAQGQQQFLANQAGSLVGTANAALDPLFRQAGMGIQARVPSAIAAQGALGIGESQAQFFEDLFTQLAGGGEGGDGINLGNVLGGVGDLLTGNIGVDEFLETIGLSGGEAGGGGVPPGTGTATEILTDVGAEEVLTDVGAEEVLNPVSRVDFPVGTSAEHIQLFNTALADPSHVLHAAAQMGPEAFLNAQPLQGLTGPELFTAFPSAATTTAATAGGVFNTVAGGAIGGTGTAGSAGAVAGTNFTASGVLAGPLGTAIGAALPLALAAYGMMQPRDPRVLAMDRAFTDIINRTPVVIPNGQPGAGQMGVPFEVGGRTVYVQPWTEEMSLSENFSLDNSMPGGFLRIVGSNDVVQGTMSGGYEVVNEGDSFFQSMLQQAAEAQGIDIRGLDTGAAREAIGTAQQVTEAREAVAQGAQLGDVLPSTPVPPVTPPSAAAPSGSTQLALQNPFPPAFRTNLATQGLDVRELSNEQIQFLWENPQAIQQLGGGRGGGGGR